MQNTETKWCAREKRPCAPENRTPLATACAAHFVRGIFLRPRRRPARRCCTRPREARVGKVWRQPARCRRRGTLQAPLPSWPVRRTSANRRLNRDRRRSPAPRGRERRAAPCGPFGRSFHSRLPSEAELLRCIPTEPETFAVLLTA